MSNNFSEELSTIQSIAKQMARKFYYHDVDDFVSIGHETMAKLLKDHDSSKSTMRTRLYTQVRYDIIDYLRHIGHIDHHNTKASYRHFEYIDWIASSEDSVETVIEQKKMSSYLHKSVLSLKRNHSFVLYNYFYNDMTLKEIGNMIGVSECRASQIVKSGIEKIKQNLKEAV